jgi:hypothetical protein
MPACTFITSRTVKMQSVSRKVLFSTRELNSHGVNFCGTRHKVKEITGKDWLPAFQFLALPSRFCQRVYLTIVTHVEKPQKVIKHSNDEAFELSFIVQFAPLKLCVVDTEARNLKSKRKNHNKRSQPILTITFCFPTNRHGVPARLSGPAVHN